MSRKVIARRPRRRIVVIDEDFVDICQGAPNPHCAAAILNQMEYWYSVRLAHKPQAEAMNAANLRSGMIADQDTTCWVYKTQDALDYELIGLFGERALLSNTHWLVDRNFLEVRTNPHDPRDRTKQYLFNTAVVQQAVDAIPPDEGPPEMRDHPALVRAEQSAVSRNVYARETDGVSETTTETTTPPARPRAGEGRVGRGGLAASPPPEPDFDQAPAAVSVPAIRPDDPEERRTWQMEDARLKARQAGYTPEEVAAGMAEMAHAAIQPRNPAGYLLRLLKTRREQVALHAAPPVPEPPPPPKYVRPPAEWLRNYERQQQTARKNRYEH